jgi:hypothetical protein
MIIFVSIHDWDDLLDTQEPRLTKPTDKKMRKTCGTKQLRGILE